MKKTFEEIRRFSIFGGIVKQKHNQSKMAYAITKVNNKLKMVSDYNEKVEDIQIDNCNTNEEAVIVYDITKDGNGKEIRHYQFKKEKHKNKVKEERELWKNWENKEFDIEPYFGEEIPKDISSEEREALEGFVIKCVSTKTK